MGRRGGGRCGDGDVVTEEMEAGLLVTEVWVGLAVSVLYGHWCGFVD